MFPWYPRMLGLLTTTMQEYFGGRSFWDTTVRPLLLRAHLAGLRQQNREHCYAENQGARFPEGGWAGGFNQGLQVSGANHGNL